LNRKLNVALSTSSAGGNLRAVRRKTLAQRLQPGLDFGAGMRRGIIAQLPHVPHAGQHLFQACRIMDSQHDRAEAANLMFGMPSTPG
jgi:hypothetical protein